MRALVWVTEEHWEEAVDGARRLLGTEIPLTLMQIFEPDLEAAAEAPRAGLLGRHRPPPPHERLGNADVLSPAAQRAGGPVETAARHGRPEHELVAAAARHDVLVLIRDGDRRRAGPRSLRPPTRFLVDHAPCPVLLAGTLPPP